MKALKIACILSAAIVLFLFACSKKKPPEPELPKYKWTILGYFDGNNSADQTPDGHSYVIEDLQELEQIDSTEEVQILVMLGSFKTDGDCKYYHVKTDSSEVVLHLGKKDMSDPTSLRDFIGYGIENYPAEHYMLIINDHGRGWKGVCYDAINGAGNWMDLSDLSYALSGFEFDIIWFYTPSMATAEVAYQIMERAEYMIASQFKWYLGNIMGSSVWLPYLTDDPDRDTRLFAYKIAEAIDSAARNIEPIRRFQSVLIHLARIPQLATHVSNLGRNLIDSTGSYWTEVWDAWRGSDIFYDSDSSFVDLREFARQLKSQPNLNTTIKNDAEKVETSVSGDYGAVLAKFMYPPDYKIPSGISIHFPWNQELFDSTSYVQLDFSETNWYSFISIFIQRYSDSYAGILDIKSIPTGAKVFLNEVYTGYETDAIIRGLIPGGYDVRLVKTGCEDWTRSIHINAQDSLSYTAWLKCSP